ncbi:NB-ARC domain-containing protein [Actinosynnema sp. CA-299493]
MDERKNDLSGSVVGGVVQADAVHGGVHFHGIPAPRTVPRQLLGAPAHFTDRAAELAELDSIAAQGGRALALLHGPGGVGKTALALHWAHRTRDRFGDGQLYVDLAGFSGGAPVRPADALGLFLRGLGTPPGQVPAELDERASLYRSLTADRRLVVLLDNAVAVGQVLPLLPSSSDSAVIVTSRSRLAGLVAEGARLVEVGPLGESSAVRLLSHAVGGTRITREQAHARELAGMCGGLPIALRVAAARLAARPRWSVQRVVAEFTDERDRLSALSPRSELSVRTTFDLSYRALGPAAAALYRRLAQHPGPDFGPAVVGSVLDEPPERALDLLDELVQDSLVEETVQDRYRFHDLLLLHARDQAGAQERADALHRVLEWYLAAARVADLVVTPHRRRLSYEFRATPPGQPRLADREAALSWLETERANLIAAGRTALDHGWPHLAWQLSDVMWPLLLHHKHYRDRLGINECGIAAARRLGDLVAEADMLKRQGLALTTLGRFTEAEEHLTASADRATTAGDRRGAADAREMLALLHLDRDEPAKALAELHDLVRINRELAADRSLGLILIHLGTALGRTGQPAAGLEALHEAVRLFDGLAEPDPYNRARVTLAMAKVHHHDGNGADADRLGEAALAAMRELGSDRGAAEAHELLAESATERTDAVRAAEHWRHALRLLTKLGSNRVAPVSARLADVEPSTRLG